MGKCLTDDLIRDIVRQIQREQKGAISIENTDEVVSRVLERVENEEGLGNEIADRFHEILKE